MTAEDIIKNALDGTFWQWEVDRFVKRSKPVDWIPTYGDSVVDKEVREAREAIVNSWREGGRTFKAWTREEDERLMKMRAARLSRVEIALALERTLESVAGRLRQHREMGVA